MLHLAGRRGRVGVWRPTPQTGKFRRCPVHMAAAAALVPGGRACDQRKGCAEQRARHPQQAQAQAHLIARGIACHGGVADDLRRRSRHAPHISAR